MICVEGNRRNYFSLGNILTILGLLGAIGVAYGDRVADSAVTKNRLSVVEGRQSEDRVIFKQDVKEVKEDVKQIGSDVQRILIKLESMEATRRAERREDRQ